ncbi:MAG TPA: hypothetical protein VKJ47_12070 [Candidatus Binatia bacterium]|nr:hypothetical protein [Candidatus Binatia bacterium]
MKTPERIDILQEFVAQYAREEMLAFFEFTLERVGQEPLPGLGRISQPKHGSSSLRYLSLAFVFDTPNEAAKTAIEQVFAHLSETSLRAALPQAVGLVPTPPLHTGPEHYIRQIDILLGAHTVPDKRFISESLAPALHKILPLQFSEVSWWEVRPQAPPDAGHDPQAKEEHGTSLVAGLKNFFHRLSKGDGT